MKKVNFKNAVIGLGFLGTVVAIVAKFRTRIFRVFKKKSA